MKIVVKIRGDERVQTIILNQGDTLSITDEVTRPGDDIPIKIVYGVNTVNIYVRTSKINELINAKGS